MRFYRGPLGGNVTIEFNSKKITYSKLFLVPCCSYAKGKNSFHCNTATSFAINQSLRFLKFRSNDRFYLLFQKLVV